MPYQLRNSKLKQFTHLAGTPPSPFRKKKVTVIGDDDEVITSSDVLSGDDSDFDVDYTGASNLEPIVISNKNISKKAQKEIISEEKSKPKVKNTIGSTEVDDIAEKESYDATMAPLIEGFKDDVREGMGKAAQTIMDVGLMAAPMPGAGLIAKGIGAGVRGITGLAAKGSRLFGLGKSVPKGVFSPSFASSNLAKANKFNLENINLQTPGQTSTFGYFNKGQREGVKKYMNVLAEGGPAAKSARLQEIKNLSSPEGFSRLVGQELQYLKDAAGGRGFTITTGHGGDSFFRQKFIKPENFMKYAKENASKRIQELKFPSVNEQLASIKSKGKFGFFNFGKAQDALYKHASGSNVSPYARGFQNNAFAETVASGISPGPLSRGTNPISYRFRVDRPKWGLGTGKLNRKDIAVHEIGHVLQKGIPSKLDEGFKALKPKIGVKGMNKIDQDYFYTGSLGKEAVPFAREARSKMVSSGILKNRYSPITEKVLKDAEKLNTRLLNITNRSGGNRRAMTSLFKNLPAVGAPVLGGNLLFSGDKK
tara:strand:+ start:4808 stop:6418 length:1611 start_codon:yes stop_codon:yes gene_type:complete